MKTWSGKLIHAMLVRCDWSKDYYEKPLCWKSKPYYVCITPDTSNDGLSIWHLSELCYDPIPLLCVSFGCKYTKCFVVSKLNPRPYRLTKGKFKATVSRRIGDYIPRVSHRPFVPEV